MKRRVLLVAGLAAIIVASKPLFAEKAKTPKNPDDEARIILVANDCGPDFTTHMVRTARAWMPDIEYSDCFLSSSPEGSALIQGSGTTLLPLMVFPANVRKLPQFNAVLQNGLLHPLDGERFYSSDRRFALVFGHQMLNREAKPAQLELFTTASCPFSSAAAWALLKQKQEKPESAFALRIRYKGTDTEDIYRSIIQERFPEQLLTYIQQRSSLPFKEAAEKAGLDAAFIEQHADEGKAIVEENSRLAQAAEAQTDPAFLWENQYLVDSLQGLIWYKAFEGLRFSDSMLGGCGLAPWGKPEELAALMQKQDAGMFENSPRAMNACSSGCTTCGARNREDRLPDDVDPDPPAKTEDGAAAAPR